MTDYTELLDSYYEELDPVQRKKHLEALSEAAGSDDALLDYRKQLFSYRYTDPKNPGRMVDNYLMSLLTFLYLFRNSFVFPKRFIRETQKQMRDMEQDERVHMDDAYAEAYSLEVRNAVRRYFSTCTSASYHKKLFGTTTSSAEEKEKQRCIDTWRMSTGIAERLGMQKEMELFCKAVAEEYRLSRADGASLESAYRALKK